MVRLRQIQHAMLRFVFTPSLTILFYLSCYYIVAVCGLPEANDMHAVIMCRFAHYCRVQMKQITHQLEESLGSGTKDLALRVGLHSGPTTAGVLRGEKARFQLFGDTGKQKIRIFVYLVSQSNI